MKFNDVNSGDFFEKIKGKKVKIFLNWSIWSEQSVFGEVIDFSESWVYLKHGKYQEIIKISEIKRIMVYGT